MATTEFGAALDCLVHVPIVLIGIFIVVAFWARWRESRRVRRELDALNEFEK